MRSPGYYSLGMSREVCKDSAPRRLTAELFRVTCGWAPHTACVYPLLYAVLKTTVWNSVTNPHVSTGFDTQGDKPGMPLFFSAGNRHLCMLFNFKAIHIHRQNHSECDTSSKRSSITRSNRQKLRLFSHSELQKSSHVSRPNIDQMLLATVDPWGFPGEKVTM